MEDTRKANLRLVTARERSSQLGKEVSTLDARIAALSLELENKRTVLKAATEEVEDMAARIEYNLDKRNGLCIRCTKMSIQILCYSFFYYEYQFHASQAGFIQFDRHALYFVLTPNLSQFSFFTELWTTRLSRTFFPLLAKLLAHTRCANTGKCVSMKTN